MKLEKKLYFAILIPIMALSLQSYILFNHLGEISQRLENDKAFSEKIMVDIADSRKMAGYALVGCVFLAGFALLWLGKRLSQRILRLQDCLSLLEKGDYQKISHENAGISNSEDSDELEQMNFCIQRLAEKMKTRAMVAEKVAAGDLRVSFNGKENDDLLAVSLQKMVDSLNELIGNLISGVGEPIF